MPAVLEKFTLYSSFGLEPITDDFYPLISKWGRIELEPYAGGAKLLFNEALKGVIGWGVAAWLFAINRSFLMALFQRETAPIRRMFSREGAAELTDGTIRVLRWGLWMAPIPPVQRSVYGDGQSRRRAEQPARPRRLRRHSTRL